MDELVVALIFTLASVFSTLVLALFLVALYCLCFGSRGIQLGDGLPGAFDDSEQFLEEEAAALEIMDDRSRQSYLMAKRWIENNPPNSADTDISLSQFMTIQEKAVAAWEFTFDIMQQSSAFVQNRTEVEFRSSDDMCCVQTNLPLPKQKEVYYWEVKIYELAPDSRIAVGLTTKPYPVFRLPGMHRYSIAYESSGYKRLNQPFMATPYGRPWQRGDVIGVGYRSRTGTVFFTHNGKKLEEVVHGMRVNLFPTVGSIGPANVYVNLGQAAFVFIQANVKEWGLAPAQGSLAPPPAYGDQEDSLLLESTTVAGPSTQPAWGAPAAPPYVRRRSSDAAHLSAAPTAEEDIHTPPGSPPLVANTNAANEASESGRTGSFGSNSTLQAGAGTQEVPDDGGRAGSVRSERSGDGRQNEDQAQESPDRPDLEQESAEHERAQENVEQENAQHENAKRNAESHQHPERLTRERLTRKSTDVASGVFRRNATQDATQSTSEDIPLETTRDSRWNNSENASGDTSGDTRRESADRESAGSDAE